MTSLMNASVSLSLMRVMTRDDSWRTNQGYEDLRVHETEEENKKFPYLHGTCTLSLYAFRIDKGSEACMPVWKTRLEYARQVTAIKYGTLCNKTGQAEGLTV